MLNVMLGYIPLGVFLFCTENLINLEKKLYLWSWPTLILLAFVIVINSIRGTANYDMAGGYGLLLPVMLFFQAFFEKKGWWNALAGILGTFLILVYCSRGPLFCIAVFIL